MEQFRKTLIMLFLILVTVSSMANANNKTNEEAEIKIEEEEDTFKKEEAPSYWDYQALQTWLANNVVNFTKLYVSGKSDSGEYSLWGNIKNFFADVQSGADSSFGKNTFPEKPKESGNKQEQNNQQAQPPTSDDEYKAKETTNEQHTRPGGNLIQTRVSDKVIIHKRPFNHASQNHSMPFIPAVQVSVIDNNSKKTLDEEGFLGQVVIPDINSSVESIKQSKSSIININFKLDSIFMSNSILGK